MYRILGADQKEYGPVNADQVRQWIIERRLNSQSLVQAEGTTDWKPLSAFPEFAAPLAGAAAIPAPLSPAAAAGAPSNNGMATAGLVMGILSVVFGWACCGLFSI